MTRLFSVLLVLFAASDRDAGAPRADGFANFFAEFRAAIARNDARAVADRTKLPFLFEGKPRDHGSFQKVYPDFLTRRFEPVSRVPRRSEKAIATW